MKYFKLLLLITFLFPFILKAEETNRISLSLSEKAKNEICKIPLWQNKEMIWLSNEDARLEKELGWQKQGKSEKEVYSNESLENVFARDLKTLFEKCGAKFLASDAMNHPEAWQLQFKVKQFDSGVKKGIFTGKEMASSRLEFIFKKGSKTQSVESGFEIEAKKMRKKGLKQLQKSLQELYDNSLQQLFLNAQLKQL